MNAPTRKHYKQVKFRTLNLECCWTCEHMEQGYEGELWCNLMQDQNIEKMRKHHEREERTGREDLPLPVTLDESVGPLDMCNKYERPKKP